MATFIGTTGQDILRGTTGDDLFQPLGTDSADAPDKVIGLDGADTYDLTPASGAVMSVVLKDKGTDGAADAIINAGAMSQSASLGYQGWATAMRVGDDLRIHLPGKPYRFHDPAKPAYDIVVVDHFAGTGIETMEAGGVVYQLADGATGSALADIVAGTKGDDVLSGAEGDDWLFGNRGHDSLSLGAGDDVGFGGDGRDQIFGGLGDDTIFGDDGHDWVQGDDGNDWLDLGLGNDSARGGLGVDWIYGGDGKDRVLGEAGADVIDLGAGDDVAVGGTGGDLYRYWSEAGDAGWGQDRLRDKGDAASWAEKDVVELMGFYGPSSGNADEAYARVAFTRSGDSLRLSADGGISTLLMVDALSANANRFAIEELQFNGAYWEPLHFQILNGSLINIGDDRAYPQGYSANLNEILMGTGGDDQVFGGAGTNFIWLGAGADTLVYKENDPENLFGWGGGLSHDIVEDFDPTQDRFDFTEVGAGFGDLVIGADSDGDATVFWQAPDFEIASILIELRGVTQAEVTEDLFLF